MCRPSQVERSLLKGFAGVLMDLGGVSVCVGLLATGHRLKEY